MDIEFIDGCGVLIFQHSGCDFWTWEVSSLTKGEGGIPMYRPGIGFIRGDCKTREEAETMAHAVLPLIGTMRPDDTEIYPLGEPQVAVRVALSGGGSEMEDCDG